MYSLERDFLCIGGYVWTAQCILYTAYLLKNICEDYVPMNISKSSTLQPCHINNLRYKNNWLFLYSILCSSNTEMLNMIHITLGAFIHTVCCCLLKCTRISCKICAYFSHYTYCKNVIMAVYYSDHIQCVLTQNSEFSSSGPQSSFSGLTLVQWVIGQVRWRDLQIILPNIQDTQNTVPWPCWNTHTITL